MELMRFQSIFGGRCVSCQEMISLDELVMQVFEKNVFHVDCFKCSECGDKLEKGDEYIFKDNKLYCSADFNVVDQRLDIDVFSSDETSSISTASSEGYDKISNGCKRPRTILTSQQRQDFKTAFELTPKPCRKVREQLSNDTGLSVRVVQVWFQNQRAKLKKIQHKTDNGKTTEEKLKKIDPQNKSIKKKRIKTALMKTEIKQSSSTDFNLTQSSDVKSLLFTPSTFSSLLNINDNYKVSTQPYYFNNTSSTNVMTTLLKEPLEEPSQFIPSNNYSTGRIEIPPSNNFIYNNNQRGSNNKRNNSDSSTTTSTNQFQLMPHLINAYL